MPQIATHQFAAADVLRITPQEAGRAGVAHLNWRVGALPKRQRSAEAMVGAGLYGVCIDGSLGYVGSFLGSSPGGRGEVVAALAGDIALARWWQHVGSMTGRSHKLHVAARTLDSLTREFGAHHPMVAALLRADDVLFKDAGCLGALGRLRWAASRFDELARAAPEQALARFSFVYARVARWPGLLTPKSLARIILDSESELVADLNPLINGAGQDASRPSARLDSETAVARIADALRHRLSSTRPHSAHAFQASCPSLQVSRDAMKGRT
jgi:hypothetical protein